MLKVSARVQHVSYMFKLNMMVSLMITSYKKIIAKYLGVVKASLTHPAFSFHYDPTTSTR